MIQSKTPDINKLPGGYVPPIVPVLEGGRPIAEKIKIYDSRDYNAFVIHDVLTQKDCDTLIQFMSDAPVIAPVSVHGFMSEDKHDDVAGSMRTTMWAPELSDQVWSIIANKFGPRIMKDKTPTDWWQDGMIREWTPVDASPMMRFMKYESGGEHYAHYDAGFFYEDSIHRTLMSFVLYLTTNTEGGSTRFIDDGQADVPVYERNHDDWTKPTEDQQVLAEVHPKAGSILVFDHRLCHDVQRYVGQGPRIIVRGDIVFKPTYDE